MSREILQIRDVPAADVAVLRDRAAASGKSLSALLRELIHESANRPTMAEALAGITTRERVEVDDSEIRSFIEDDRRP